MDGAGSTRQIQQMVDFIKLEAREKATEIRTKTDNDYNLEKQMLVHKAKLKLQEEYAKREKHAAVQVLIETSKAVGEQRTRKYTERDLLMQRLERDTFDRLRQFPTAAPDKYQALLAGLVEQGAARLRETDIEVLCREVDVPVVTKVLEKARITMAGTTLTLSTRRLPATSAGGLVLTACDGRIKCDSTLESRTRLAIKDLQPVVRHILFPSTRAVKRRDSFSALVVPTE